VTFNELLGVAATLTLVGGLAVAFELSPLARTRFARNWIYGAMGRAASRRLSISGLLLGIVLFVVAGVWALFR
jgi:hypothetical protein